MRRLCFEIILLVAGVMLGACLENPIECWLTGWRPVGLAVIVVCMAAIILSAWREHRRKRADKLDSQADRWDEQQRLKHSVAQLKAFWKSLAGQQIDKNPFLANDSVRIEPIDGGYRPPPSTLGVFTIQIDETHVVHVQAMPPEPSFCRVCIAALRLNRLVSRKTSSERRPHRLGYD